MHHSSSDQDRGSASRGVCIHGGLHWGDFPPGGSASRGGFISRGSASWMGVGYTWGAMGYGQQVGGTGVVK